MSSFINNCLEKPTITTSSISFESEQDSNYQKKKTRKINLSNDFTKIINAYIRQTGNYVCFTDEIKWLLIKKPPKKIKYLMEKYNVKYAMTYFMDGEYRIIQIYKHTKNKYYSVCYSVKPSKTEQVHASIKNKYPFFYYLGVCFGFMQGLINLFYHRIKQFFQRSI